MSNWKILYDKPKNIKDILRNIINEKKIKKEYLKDYLNCRVPTHDSYLMDNMQEAIKEITNYKNIVISGDYDCDGICATAIMYIGLQELAKFYHFNVDYIIPLRQDGYGLSTKIIDQANEKNADVILTVDNGIAAMTAVNYAHLLGIDVIITDHHKPQIDPVTETVILPDCLIVDPQIDNYPYKYICGACVAFKFIEKLFEETLKNFNSEFNTLKEYNINLYDELLSLTAIATVADVMKITDENRFYVGVGLQKLQHTKNIGLKTLIKQTDIVTLNVDSIAYTIGPIINAAGRMDTPYLAFNLIITEDINECEKLAKKLISLNSQRRKMQKNAIDNIPPQILNDSFIVVYDPTIAKGILGTIASAITEKYRKPCFVLSGNEELTKSGKLRLTGSGRSSQGYPILNFIQDSKDIVEGGGHEAACGISLLKENLDLLRTRCNQHFQKWLNTNNKQIDKNIYALCELDFDFITMDLANNLKLLEPFGLGNSKPLFVINDVFVKEAYIIGTNDNAIKFILEKNEKEIKGIGFSNIIPLYKENIRTMDIICAIDLNEWPKNNFTLQLQIIDIHPRVIDDNNTLDINFYQVNN